MTWPEFLASPAANWLYGIVTLTLGGGLTYFINARAEARAAKRAKEIREEERSQEDRQRWLNTAREDMHTLLYQASTLTTEILRVRSDYFREMGKKTNLGDNSSLRNEAMHEVRKLRLPMMRSLISLEMAGKSDLSEAAEALLSACGNAPITAAPDEFAEWFNNFQTEFSVAMRVASAVFGADVNLPDAEIERVRSEVEAFHEAYAKNLEKARKTA